MTIKAPQDWHITSEPDAKLTRAILTACRCGSQETFASLYASTSLESLPPLSYCLYIATTVSRWPPLVSYILSLEAASPDNWPGSQRDNARARRGLGEGDMYDYVYYSILSSVSAGDTALVQCFLDAGLKPDTVLEHRHDRVDCLLERAVTANQPDMVRYLLARGAKPNHELMEGEPFTVIASAARNDLPGILRLLVAANGGRVKGTCALWHAAISSAFDAAETLLDLGADINELFNYDSYEEDEPVFISNGMGTALHCTVYERQLEFAHWLLQKGARIDVKDGACQTARDLAVEKGYSEMQEMLENWEKTHTSKEVR